MNLRLLAALSLLVSSFSGLAAAQTPAAQSPAASEFERSLEPYPIVTGGIALNAGFEPHENTLNPVVAPIILLPVGRHALIETEFEAESDIVYSHGEYDPVTLDKKVEYAQLDWFASKYLTVVAGRFATPFNVYKERFDARWIRNLIEEPLIFGFSDTSNNGGQLRGAVPLGSSLQLSYSTYFSAQTANISCGAERQAGLRTALFFPGARVEAGFSFNRRLADARYNSFGTDFTWNLRQVPLDIRSETLFSTGVGKGYWVEGAYRLSSSRFPHWLRPSQAVVRGEQFFAPGAGFKEDVGFPDANASRTFFGGNYWITDSIRASAAYGRQFASDDNHNLWTVGLSYRFVK